MRKSSMPKRTFRPDRIITDNRRCERSIHRFRTIDDMAFTLKQSIDHGYNYQRAMSRKQDSGDNWYGTKTIEEYEDILTNGWDAGVKDVEGLDGLCSDAPERLTFERNVGGVFPIVPVALTGAPNAMLDVRPQPVDRERGLSLVIDGSFPARVKGHTVLTYAQQIMRLVAWLQAEQIETSVYCVLCLLINNKRIIWTTPVRATGQILQPERIAAVLHTSWFRRAWFSMLEYEANVLGDADCLVENKSGYGTPKPVQADEMREVLPEAYSVIILPKPGSGDPTKAVQEALSLKLRRQE